MSRLSGNYYLCPADHGGPAGADPPSPAYAEQVVTDGMNANQEYIPPIKGILKVRTLVIFSPERRILQAPLLRQPTTKWWLVRLIERLIVVGMLGVHSADGWRQTAGIGTARQLTG
jgi:hypothetical protein